MYIIGQQKMSGSIGAVKMTGFTYIAFLICFACSAAVGEDPQETTTTTTPEDVARRELTDGGYVIRYKDSVYQYPWRVEPVVVREGAKEGGPEETNAIGGEEERRRPLFYLTRWEEVEEGPRGRLPASGPYIEIRRKREVNGTEIPEESKVGKLRRKRTYCGRCGYGGYRKVYVPVTYVVYPVYYGGGGRGGCHTCGGGYGGGGGGSYSFSSSQSSAGSFSWGK